ncbi:MAG: hypothetical protein AAGG38_04965 [Planctomycetota bacterium]
MTTPTFRRNLRPFSALACAAVLLLAVGCSQDRHVFRSTALAPKSVSLVSVETGNTLWTKNVPPNQQLLLDFSRGGRGFEEYSSPDVPADEVKWQLWSLDATTRFGTRRNGGKVLDRGSETLPGEAFTIKLTVLDPEVASAN